MTADGFTHLHWQDLRAAFLLFLGGGLLVFDLVLNTPGEVQPTVMPIYGALLGIEFVIRGKGGSEKKDDAPPPPAKSATEEALEAAIAALAAARKNES